MKYIFSFILFMCGLNGHAQNEITTPAGQPLKVGPLNITGNIDVSSGSFMFNNIRFLSRTGTQNILVGEESGSAITTGIDNAYLGYRSGYMNTTGSDNTFFGSITGRNNTTGFRNTFLGSTSGYNNTTGNSNTYVGFYAGYYNATGSLNTVLGSFSGYYNTSGSDNTFIGRSAGTNNVSGSGNIFLGSNAGKNELGSNKLYISNNDTSTPLIYGDFSAGKLILNGQVGAGTSNFPSSVSVLETNGSTSVKNTSAYKLFVKNGILTEQLIITSGWADYVFDKSYKLRPLSEVEQYIRHNGHLPNVPSAVTVGEIGIDVGDMTRIQQEKIEELTLYIIELEKRVNHLTDLFNQSSHIK